MTPMTRPITREEYVRSFTPGAIDDFRSRCRQAASALNSIGRRTDHNLRVEELRIEIPRTFLGFRLQPEVRVEQVTALAGWRLAERDTLLGQDGDEWYKWTTICVLGQDGELYKVVHEVEEFRGARRKDEMRTERYGESGLDLWDRVVVLNEHSSPSYWGPFPQALGKALDKLLP